MSNGHHVSCDGCVPCQEDGCPEVAYCVNEWPVIRPCPHNEPYCGDHNIENCAECREQLEAEIRADLDRAYATFGGDPFARDMPEHDRDPLDRSDRWQPYNTWWRKATKPPEDAS